MEGDSLQQTKAQWEAALDGALETFRNLIAESSSKAWKPVQTPSSNVASPNPGSSSSFSSSSSSSSPAVASSASTNPSGTRSAKIRDPSSLRHVNSIGDVAKNFVDGVDDATTRVPGGEAPRKPITRTGAPFKLANLRPESVVIHRRSQKGPDVYRAVAEVPYEGDIDLTAFRAVLQTTDAWSSWDRLVSSTESLEQLSPTTRINKVNYRLGWPASPRDAVTISKIISDDSTLIAVSTSLPRSPDAPAYLRPAPPCVRSHVHLMAWCIQMMGADTSAAPSTSLQGGANKVSGPSVPMTTSNSSGGGASGSGLRGPRIKLTTFWSWDLKGAWMGMPAGGLGMHLPELVKGLVTQVRDSSAKTPIVANYGSCIEVLSSDFDPTRDTLSAEYAVVVEDATAREAEDRAHKDLDTLNLLRARRKLDAGIEFSLPDMEAWDVQVSLRSQTQSQDTLEWHAQAERAIGSHRITLTIRHARLEQVDEILKVRVKIQRVVASTGLRLNDQPFDIESIEPRTPVALSQPLLEDAASISGISVATTSTSSASSSAMGAMANVSRSGTPSLGSANLVNNQIRRNYIYFTSLLQEPEAKWKHVSDLKGVTVTQLDSIDPTLVVYRAEATFVGISVWDLFSTISNPGARAFWDKSLDDAVLLSDINDLSSLWHLKTKPSWPVSARDTVVIQTAYKAPASVHVFSFSTDDRAQFPQIPAVDASTIRTQVDLRGWSVEALSPTTVHVTMLEQSDPKGWTSKSATPAAMVSAVAGVGEYAIKFGGPPVLTRLLGAQAKISRYDHEKATFRLEYASIDSGTEDDLSEMPNIECEIRCDVETWTAALDLVVDPPPISVSCLRRHKLSQGGGGLWLTIEHVAASLEDDVARITIRKSTSRDKGAVYVNGATIKIDVDDLNEDEVQQLTRQKRIRPQRIPLDLAGPSPRTDASATKVSGSSTASSVNSHSGSAETYADDTVATADGTDIAGSSIKPQAGTGLSSDREKSLSEDVKTRGVATTSKATFFSDERPRQPMTCALDVLFLLRRIHAERSPDPAGNPAGWALVSERNGLYVRRKLMESISSTVLVQRGDKVVQGLSAEDLLDVIASPQCRKRWDDKVESVTLLECYGNGATTSFITTKASFPFRGRAFHLASMTARGAPATSGLSASSPGESVVSSSASSWSGPAVYFHASASFPEQNSRFPLTNLNPQALPMGKILIDGWILETLDPYSSTSFQIPSTRCTHVVAVDYAGSLPVAVNSMWNSNLPRSVLLVEEYLKARGSIPSVKTPPACFQVLGDGRDEDQGLVWVTNNPDRKNLLLSTSFDPATRTFAVASIHRPMKRVAEPISAATSSSATPILLPAAEVTDRDGVEATLRSRPSSVSDASTTKAAAVKAASTPGAAPGTPSLASVAPPVGSNGEPGPSLSRAASMHSIASTSATSTSSTFRQRPSSIRADSRRATDLLLMEVEVELRHFAKGYDVQVYSELIRARTQSVTRDTSKERVGAATAHKVSTNIIRPAKSDRTQPFLALTAASAGRKDLPVQIKVYDLPPSAVLAATLDPSARPRKHLIRVSVATTTFLDPIEDPLTGTKPPEIPDWYVALQERGAVLRMVIKPLSADIGGADGAVATAVVAKDVASNLFATPSGKISVKSDGAKLDIIHVNQTSAMLQREQIGIEPMTQLRRAAPFRSQGSKATRGNGPPQDVTEDDRLPAALKQPIAIDTVLFKVKEIAGSEIGSSSSAKTNGPAGGKTSVDKGSGLSAPTAATGTATSDDGTFASSTGTAASGANSGVGLSASTAALVAEGSSAAASGSATPSAPLSTGQQIMNMFGSYPLSRLGTSSALASVSSVTARGSSIASTSSAKTNAEALAAQDRAKQMQKNGSAKGTTSGTTNAAETGRDSVAFKEAGDAASVAANAASSAVDAATSAGSTLVEVTRTTSAALCKLASESHFRFSTLVLVALASFLLGSLFRSLLSPMDFVLVPTRTAPFALDSSQRPEAAKSNRLLGMSPGRGDTGQPNSVVKPPGTASALQQGRTPTSMVRQVQWTELRRMLHLRTPGSGWELVVGAVRRRA
ncbi:hypothetical protein BCV70DRAFT_155235 [Testicularia cyperi]|uniref:START domain-containing protein n=1 Tax=Testicularia cyperi TaxID=1882483 RepID=A0A317Y021_9BASI|nr:hypothetical protein BCV70DRAFT_155235 [Testicularia cyperi]